MRKWRAILLAGCTSAGLFSCAALAAQSHSDPLAQESTVVPETTAVSASLKPESRDPLELLGMRIELAWLADPLTFPYFLQVRAKGTRLELRGTVPSKSVHDQALNIARLHTAVPIVDAIEENHRVSCQPARLTQAQLQTTVLAALSEAFPRDARYLHVACTSEGAVHLSGPIAAVEQKLALSRMLRRLLGCTSVVHQTDVYGAESARPAAPSRVNTARQPPT